MTREAFVEMAKANTKRLKDIFLIDKKFFDKHCEGLDEDGYPTQTALRLIETWHWEDPEGWFEFIKDLWYASDWGWRSSVHPHRHREQELVDRIEISTAGWSGNERIIESMQKNSMLWFSTWFQSNRGGHYIFEVDK